MSLPPELTTTTPAEQAVFLDNNVLLRAKFLAQLKKICSPVISSVVFGELLCLRPKDTWRESVLELLRGHGIRIVPVDGADAGCFWELMARKGLRFDAGPLLRPGEDHRRCRDRLRFDLFIFAVALRHRRLLVTDNKNDFEHFPYRENWQTRHDFARTHGWEEPP